MSRVLVIIVFLQAATLGLLWLIRAPQRVLYLFVALAVVPVGLGKLHGQALPAAYLLIPMATALYLVDRLRKSRTPEPRRSGHNGIWILALFFFAAVSLQFFRRPILPGDLAGAGKTPVGIHAWMAFGLGACYFLVFSSITFAAPSRTRHALRFAAMLCLALCVFGLLLAYIRPLQEALLEVKETGFIRPGFFMTRASDVAAHRYRDPGGGFHLGTLSIVGSMLLLLTLSGTGRPAAKLLLALFSVGAVLHSGMRASFVGVVAALMAWLLITRRLTLAVAFALLLGGGLIVSIAMVDEFPTIVRRSLSLVSEDSLETEPRVVLFAMYADSIKENPLFGVGFGEASTVLPESRWDRFIAINLRRGGHGSYVSVLYLFGMVALLPFVGLLAAALVSSVRVLRQVAVPAIHSMALFCFLFVSYYLFPMGVEGNGGDPLLFGVLGIAGGLSARDWTASRAMAQQVEP